MHLEIGFIGAGKVGKALGLYFKSHGLKITGYYSRTEKSAQEAAEITGSQVFSTIKVLADANRIIFITVPDLALEEIDKQASALVRRNDISKEKTWFHVSGAHPSGYLSGLEAEGCAVGSMHPLQSFGEPQASADRLQNTWFTIEGTRPAVLTAKAVLEQTGSKYSLIEAGNKPLYHVGACIVSNFLVTLLESGIRCFEAAGMDREHIIKAIEPLVDATLSNVRDKGPIDALTGPVVRADFNTVDTHLKALETVLPSELDFYTAMVRKTAQMLKGGRLTSEQTEIFMKMMEDASHGG